MAEPFPICYLNGEYVALRDARISPLDRGFLFADSVYEVVPWIEGKFFRFTEHFNRLDRSLGAIRLQSPHGHPEWDRLLSELAKRNGGGDMYVYVQVTRGMEYGRNHAFPTVVRPTVFAMTSPLPAMTPEAEAHGVAVITVEDFRWGRCDIKATGLLANVLIKQQAAEAGAQEALIVSEGNVLEGSSTSVLAVFGNTLVTPPNGPHILPGTTRDAALEYARDLLKIEIRPLELAELRRADEIMLAAATRDLLPVGKLDGSPVGDGKPGRYWRELSARFVAARARRV